jgi:hypothetical protein
MADIPAANLTEQLHFNMGSLKAWKVKVKGDGTGVTINTPFSRVEFYFTQSIDDTAIPATTISESGGTLTYAAAPTSTKYHTLVVAGY